MGAPSTSRPRPQTAPAAPRRTPACRRSKCSRGTSGTETKEFVNYTSLELAHILGCVNLWVCYLNFVRESRPEGEGKRVRRRKKKVRRFFRISCLRNLHHQSVHPRAHSCQGLPSMTSAKVSDFFTQFPLVTVTNQLILFLSSAFWGPPSPHPLWTSYTEAPLGRGDFGRNG